jgi:hypothetical protein
MKRILLVAVVAGLVAPVALPQAASAGPGKPYKYKPYKTKALEKRAQCDRKLAEAKSYADFLKKADQCNRELARLSFDQRNEAAKEWSKREKEWRKNHRYYVGTYYRWDHYPKH